MINIINQMQLDDLVKTANFNEKHDGPQQLSIIARHSFDPNYTLKKNGKTNFDGIKITFRCRFTFNGKIFVPYEARLIIEHLVHNKPEIEIIIHSLSCVYFLFMTSLKKNKTFLDMIKKVPEAKKEGLEIFLGFKTLQEGKHV